MKLGSVLIWLVTATSGQVQVGAGEWDIIVLKGVDSVSVDNPAIAEANVMPDGVRISGVSKGSTALHVRQKDGARRDYTVNVGDLKLEATLTLSKGGDTSLSTPGLTRMAITDPAVARLEVQEPADVKIVALQKGDVLIEVWTGKAHKTWRLEVKD
jgi:hypothetical protein